MNIVKMAEKIKLTGEMTIKEIIQKKPESALVFTDYGLHCISCPMAQDETLEEAAKAHQLDLQKLLKDLNKC